MCYRAARFAVLCGGRPTDNPRHPSCELLSGSPLIVTAQVAMPHDPESRLVHRHALMPETKLAVVLLGHFPSGRYSLLRSAAGPVFHSLLLAESFDFLERL